ncbi:MAG: hypothetical protein NT120_02460 [Candidatus Aenigmarchaeota archaeon]|nr:hypothetical protein [Candidatus Aenigmarchaeota archaeon]
MKSGLVRKMGEIDIYSRSYNKKIMVKVSVPIKEKDRFLRAYSNLSLGLRNEIILVVDHKPITWNVAFIEINKNTKPGEKILKKLIALELI